MQLLVKRKIIIYPEFVWQGKDAKNYWKKLQVLCIDKIILESIDKKLEVHCDYKIILENAYLTTEKPKYIQSPTITPVEMDVK